MFIPSYFLLHILCDACSTAVEQETEWAKMSFTSCLLLSAKGILPSTQPSEIGVLYVLNQHIKKKAHCILLQISCLWQKVTMTRYRFTFCNSLDFRALLYLPRCHRRVCTVSKRRRKINN